MLITRVNGAEPDANESSIATLEIAPYDFTYTKDAASETLNSIKVPFTFTLPAITDLFAIDPGFIKENVANCYLYNDDFKKVNTTDGATTFKLSRIFSKYDTNGFTIALNNKDKVGSTNKKSNELATLTTNTVTADVLSYLTLSGTLGEETGYDQVLKLTIDRRYILASSAYVIVWL